MLKTNQAVTKEEIREEIKNIVDNIEKKDIKDSKINDTLESILNKYENINILAYSPLDDEIDITDLIVELEKGQNDIYISDIQEQGFRKLSDGAESDLFSDSKIIDVVVIPGRAFTKEGDRLGRGSGWYDRFLKELPTGVTKIGICYEDQIVDVIPLDKHDIKMEKIVTDQNLYI